MVFSLSALWWRRIRGLWKLPDERVTRKLGSVLMGGAILCKSLIQFSVDGWSCVPSLLFTWDQTMVEVMKIMETSFKRSQACQEATIRARLGKTDWFQIGKRGHQGCILSPCSFNFYAEYIMRNAGLKKHRLESRFPGEISITSDMQMTPPLWQKVKKN